MTDCPGGHFTFPGTLMTLNRLGFGPKRLAGPGVWGPPLDIEAAVNVLREAVALGVNHLDTSDYYGPHVVNELIRRAVSPYPRGFVVITKVGHRRAPDGSWPVELSPEQLTRAVHDNLCHLGLEALDVVNLRVQNAPRAEVLIEQPLSVLAALQQQGLIRHLGLSNVTPRQFAEAQRVAKIVCVQNAYSLTRRRDDAFIDDLASRGVAYVPFHPLEGGALLRDPALTRIAASLGATAAQVALAWLLHRSPNIMPIFGTSDISHLRENLQAATLHLPAHVRAELDAMSEATGPRTAAGTGHHRHS